MHSREEPKPRSISQHEAYNANATGPEMRYDQNNTYNIVSGSNLRNGASLGMLPPRPLKTQMQPYRQMTTIHQNALSNKAL